MPVPTRESVISSLKWQTLAKILTQIISWSSTIIVMRILSPGDYGLMAMASIVIGLIALISEMGFSNAIIQAENIDTYQQRCIFGASLLINSILGSLLVLASPVIADFFSEQKLEQLIPFLAIQFPIVALSTLPSAIAKRKMDFKTLSIIEMLGALTSTFVTLISAYNQQGVWALIYGQLTQSISTTILLLSRFGTPTPTLGYKGLERLIHFGTSITLNRILWYLYSQADSMIIGKILGKELLGIYSIAVTLATLPLTKINSIVNQVVFSSFSRIQNQNEKINTTITTAILVVSSIAFLLLWGLLITSRELILLLLGEKWEAAIFPLQAIAFVTPFRMISALLSTASLGLGSANTDLRNTTTSILILIPLFTVGATYGGLNGLALGWLIGSPVIFLIITKRLSKVLHITPKSITSSLKTPVYAGILMIAGTMGLTEFIKIQSLFLTISLKAIIATAIYIFSFYVINRDDLLKIIKLFKNK